MLGEAFRRINHALTFLFGQGSWSLKPHERIILDAFLDGLSDTERAVIAGQLEHLYFVERMPEGRINTFRFYDQSKLQRLNHEPGQDSYFGIQIRVKGRKQRTFVSVYNGVIHSIELPRPCNFYRNAHIEFVKRFDASEKDSYTHVLDRFEHGALAQDG